LTFIFEYAILQHMSKTIRTIKYGAIYTLILLAILVLGAITFMAKEANAASYSPYSEPVIIKESTSIPDNPIPSVTVISPDSGNLGGGAKTVTITGSGFVPGSVARLNGADRQTTFIDRSHLLIYLNASDMYGASGKYITVWNSGPGGGFSNSVLFTINGYVAPAAATSGARTNNTTSNTNSAVKGASTSNTNTSTNETNDSYGDLTSNALLGSNSFMPSGLIQWLLLAIFILIIFILGRKFYGKDKYQEKPLKHA